jgi:hypothetical protein
MIWPGAAISRAASSASFFSDLIDRALLGRFVGTPPQQPRAVPETLAGEMTTSLGFNGTHSAERWVAQRLGPPGLLPQPRRGEMKITARPAGAAQHWRRHSPTTMTSRPR